MCLLFQFSILAVAVAQPLKQGNNHHPCFSPGQGLGGQWEQNPGAIQVHPLVWQDLSPSGSAGCAQGDSGTQSCSGWL